MFQLNFIALIAIFGIFQGLFIASLFWLKKNRTHYNQLFSLLLLATSIRIAKNVIVYLVNDTGLTMAREVWTFSINFGLSQQFALGPLFFFYFKARLDSTYRLEKNDLMHFITYALLCVGSPFITWDFWKYGGLWLSYAYVIVYYLLALKLFFTERSARTNQKDIFKWLRTLLLIGAVIMIAYSPSLFKYGGFLGGAVLYALAVYLVTWMIFKDSRLYKKERYSSSSLSMNRMKDIANDCEHLMQENKLFLNSDLSLSGLASQLTISTKDLSQTINQIFNVNYADYVNAYRIDCAKQRLSDPANNHLTIAAIAMECGFESISLFNTTFKKFTKKTPKQFRNIVTDSY